MGRATTRIPYYAGLIKIGRLGRKGKPRAYKSQGPETAGPNWLIWPILFLLSHRPHTCYADTCTQGFPDIICPALSSASALVASFPCLRSTSMNTNKHKHAAVHRHKHGRAVVPTLSSCGSSLVGIVFASVATHGCVSSWEPSIPTIPDIHLSL